MQKEKTFKDVEGMLYEYQRTKAEIKDIDIEVDEIKDTVEGLKGKSNNQIMQSSPTNMTGDPVCEEILRKEEEITRLLAIKKSDERYIAKIDNMLTILSDDERSFVDLKYMQKKKGKEIGYALGLSKDGLSSKRKIVISDLVNFINSTKNTQKTH